MTLANGNAAVRAGSAAFRSEDVRGGRTGRIDDAMLRPKARRRESSTITRAAITGLLMLLAIGLAEWHPLSALLLAALAVAIQPCERPGRMPTVVSSGSLTRVGSTAKRFFSTERRSLTARTRATASRARWADSLTNRWNGER